MSLFVGNLSERVEMKELTTAFEKFGKCKIDFRVITLLNTNTFQIFAEHCSDFKIDYYRNEI